METGKLGKEPAQRLQDSRARVWDRTRRGMRQLPALLAAPVGLVCLGVLSWACLFRPGHLAVHEALCMLLLLLTG